MVLRLALNIADEIVVLDSGFVRTQGRKDIVIPSLIGTSSAVKECRGAQKGEC